jgi:tetratricopeptide (TPR) repeat protein
MTSKQKLMRYGALGVVAIVVVIGAIYLLSRGDAPAPATTASAPSSPSSPTNPKPSASTDEQTVPSANQTDRVLQLVGEARRLAAAGKFDEAEASLQKADKVIPGWPETEKARNEIAEMRTPEGQLKTQLTRARFAIEHDDKATAEKALAEAERLNAQAPEIAELRQALKEAEQKETHRGNRVTELLIKMREEIARGDFAAADSDLNAAERINIQDPAIRDARRELARAREAKQKDERK